MRGVLFVGNTRFRGWGEVSAQRGCPAFVRAMTFAALPTTKARLGQEIGLLIALADRLREGARAAEMQKCSRFGPGWAGNASFGRIGCIARIRNIRCASVPLAYVRKLNALREIAIVSALLTSMR